MSAETPNIRKVVEAIGRARLATANGVTPQQIWNVIESGRFPASWYFNTKRLAEKAGVECPPEMFSFKPAPESLGEDTA